MNTSHRARKGGDSLDKSGKQTDKVNRRKAEERIKGELEIFIRKLMGAKLIEEKTKTFNDKPSGSLPELDIKLEQKELKEICLRVREQFMLEPVLLKLQAPICVLGDLHGQFLDLRKMMEKLGTPPKQKYLFLGDYVDRGAFSLETVTMLLAMKVRYPKHIYLLRGNHETRAVNKMYGFFDECKRRFPDDKKNELWTLYQHVFNCMPMSAIIGEKIFCTHGGISEDLLSWKQFDRIIRPTDITDLGLLTDLVWADPCNETKKYEMSPRGISMVFGQTAVEDFFSNLGIELIVRGHQAVQEGYEFSADKRCLTIFSAPAYCGEQDNLAGILAISKNLECIIYTFKGVGKNAATITQSGAVGGQEKDGAGGGGGTTPVAHSPNANTAIPPAQSPAATTAKIDNKNNGGGGEKGDKAVKDTSSKEKKESSGKEKVKK
uniref:Serine/threonine-protein phosphatase n=1 Tax=Panagrolaimus sp. ES5 TaxID=591445 RepID=A0AC34FY39_9BILA